MWLDLLKVLIILATCVGSIWLLWWLYSNIRTHLEGPAKLGVFFIVCCGYAGFAAGILVIASKVLSDVWFDWFSNVPAGMYIAAMLVWPLLFVDSTIWQVRKLRSKHQNWRDKRHQKAQQKLQRKRRAV